MDESRVIAVTRSRPPWILGQAALVGLGVFVSYTVAPPRLAGIGLVDIVTESSGSYRYLQPPAFVNEYSASSLVLRALACTMPALMTWAVIATAHHCTVDVRAGIALVIIGHVVALALQRRRLRGGREPA